MENKTENNLITTEIYIVKDNKMYLMERQCRGEVLEKYDPPIHVANTFTDSVLRDYYSTWSNSTEATKS